jgi:hypothetical protein
MTYKVKPSSLTKQRNNSTRFFFKTGTSNSQEAVAIAESSLFETSQGTVVEAALSLEAASSSGFVCSKSKTVTLDVLAASSASLTATSNRTRSLTLSTTSSTSCLGIRSKSASLSILSDSTFSAIATAGSTRSLTFVATSSSVVLPVSSRVRGLPLSSASDLDAARSLTKVRSIVVTASSNTTTSATTTKLRVLVVVADSTDLSATTRLTRSRSFVTAETSFLVISLLNKKVRSLSIEAFSSNYNTGLISKFRQFSVEQSLATSFSKHQDLSRGLNLAGFSAFIIEAGLEKKLVLTGVSFVDLSQPTKSSTRGLQLVAGSNNSLLRTKSSARQLTIEEVLTLVITRPETLALTITSSSAVTINRSANRVRLLIVTSETYFSAIGKPFELDFSSLRTGTLELASLGGIIGQTLRTGSLELQQTNLDDSVRTGEVQN